MSYLIKRWYLPYEQAKEEPHQFSLKPNENWLEDLKKVNILIGPNNSGKSRFLRHLFRLSYELYSPTSFDLDHLIELINEIKNIIRNHFELRGISNIEAAYRDIFLEKIMPHNFIINTRPPIPEIKAILKAIRDFAEGTIKIYSKERPTRIYVEYSRPITEKISKIADQIDDILSKIKEDYQFHKVYIPTLRGLRPIGGSVDPFKDRTQSDYFMGMSPEHKQIFTGLEMYREVLELLTGDEEEKERLAEYERFLSKHFFDDIDLRLSPRKNSDVLYVKLGHEREFPMPMLGDGVQQLIAITFPLFMSKNMDVLAFIEEPEIYLHPGLQRKFLELLANDQLGNVQAFLTTHSNHLLDMCLDYSGVSIFKSHKDASGEHGRVEFTIESTQIADRNIIELLGVHNSSVLLTNCTIWVEGITDRLYIRRYLEMYMQNMIADEAARTFEEDKHYSFVEYSGNNIMHWSFLEVEDDPINVEALCGTLFLVADRDRGKEKRHEKLGKVLKDRFYRLECKEIENLLSPSVLLKTVGQFRGVRVKEGYIPKQDSYRNRYLGKFIDEKILEDGSKKTFAAESGTLRKKLDFAKKAITNINSLEDLSEEALNLTKRIYNFIKEHNE